MVSRSTGHLVSKQQQQVTITKLLLPLQLILHVINSKILYAYLNNQKYLHNIENEFYIYI